MVRRGGFNIDQRAQLRREIPSADPNRRAEQHLGGQRRQRPVQKRPHGVRGELQICKKPLSLKVNDVPF